MSLNRNESKSASAWLLALVAIQICLFGTFLKAQGTAVPFTMTLVGPAGSLAPGSPCEIKIVIRNTSDRDLVLKVRNDDYRAQIDFTTLVTNAASGNSVAELDRWADGTLILPLMYSFQKKHFDPGESKTVEFNLDRLFDISRPGTCRVQVSRAVPGEYGTGTVISNTISVVVGP